MHERIPKIDFSEKKFILQRSSILYLFSFIVILMALSYMFIADGLKNSISPIAQMQQEYREKNYYKVIETATKLLNKYPNSLIIRRYLWKSYLYTKQHGQALRIMGQIDKLSNQPRLESNLGYCTIYRIIGEYEKMNYYCNRVLDIRSNNEAALEQIVLSLIDQKKYTEAKNYIDKISNSLLPDSLKMEILRSNIYMLENNYSKSIEILEKLKKLFKDDVIINYYLGESYYNSNKYIEAASYLEEFIQGAAKEDIDIDIMENAYIILASSYEQAKLYSSAYKAYKKAACLSLKLNKMDLTISLINRAIAATYVGYKGLVSHSDFKKRFDDIKKEIEKKCKSILFISEEEQEND